MSTQTSQKYVAREGVASSPDAKMLGSVLLALVENLNAEDLEPFLIEYHMDKIEPNQWYSEQLILDFELAVLRGHFNSTENLVAIGVKGIDTTPFPPEIKTLEEAIHALNVMSRHVTRNSPEEAGFSLAVHSASGPILTANLPYPRDILYGYVWALVRKYRPAGKSFNVKYVENPDPVNFPGPAFKVTWE